MVVLSIDPSLSCAPVFVFNAFTCILSFLAFTKSLLGLYVVHATSFPACPMLSGRTIELDMEVLYLQGVGTGKNNRAYLQVRMKQIRLVPLDPTRAKLYFPFEMVSRVRYARPIVLGQISLNKTLISSYFNVSTVSQLMQRTEVSSHWAVCSTPSYKPGGDSMLYSVRVLIEPG